MGRRGRQTEGNTAPLRIRRMRPGWQNLRCVQSCVRGYQKSLDPGEVGKERGFTPLANKITGAEHNARTLTSEKHNLRKFQRWAA